MTVKYSLIQLNTGCNPKESYEFLKKSIRKSADQGANFISTPEKDDEVVNIDKSKNLVIDGMSIMHLIGMQIDYKKDIEDLSIINCKNIEPFLINEWKNFSGYIYFKGEIDNKKIFIKSRGLADSVSREYKIIKELKII